MNQDAAIYLNSVVIMATIVAINFIIILIFDLMNAPSLVGYFRINHLLKTTEEIAIKVSTKVSKRSKLLNFKQR